MKTTIPVEVLNNSDINSGGGDTTEIENKISSLSTRVEDLETATREGVIYGPFFSIAGKVVKGEVIFSAYAYSSSGAIEKFILNIPEINLLNQECVVSRSGIYGNSAVISFTVPEDLELETELNISLQAIDISGLNSDIISKKVIVTDGIISPPNVISPAQGTVLIGGNNNINFKCSPFSSSGIDPIEDVYADWKVSRDEDGLDVLATLNHSNRAIENYTLNALGVNDFYPVDMYVQARHGCNASVSEWGVPTLIKVTAGKKLPSGRILYRHPSEEGSVLEWDDFGVKRTTLISDCSIHITGKYNGTQVDYASKGMPITKRVNTGGNSYLWSELLNRSEYKYLTDNDLNKMWEGALDTWTSTQNTNFAIENLTSGYNYTPLISTIKTMTLAGVRPSVPNINLLIRIYCDSEALQALDPTSKNLFQMYDQNTNGIWTFGSNRGNGCWSSSFAGNMSGTQSMISIGQGSTLNTTHMGNSGNNVMTTLALCLVPILEL